ncbi:hypothetical protein [uncultured Tateyamaria sp.]|uniref:hypothetical protein n=1 Tax=uncultured Tateyamaria sp. TaxID=455651 RepID=UPI00262DB84B|nr:hypothetical protein [uncultured Tateyamaria sp.]
MLRGAAALKVDQEFSLAGAHPSEPVRTGAPNETENMQEKPENMFDPVRTGLNQISDNSDGHKFVKKNELSANASEPVRTGALDIRQADASASVLDEVRERLHDKEEENKFLREQLERAHAEIERRGTSTDEALKTIDRIVCSFEMQSETNNALALHGVTNPPSDGPEAVQLLPEDERQPEDPSVVSEIEPTNSYQQPQPEWHRPAASSLDRCA